MEIRVIGRGVLAGAIAGLLGFVFALIWAEPLVDKAIEYESARDEIVEKLTLAAGIAVEEGHEHEVVTRGLQSTLGLATGSIMMGIAMGALVAVAYLLLGRRVHARANAVVWSVIGFGFLGVFLLPFAKYPANPPAVGHDFTIAARTQLYLTTVVASLLLLGLGVWLARSLRVRVGWVKAVLVSGAAFLVLYGVLLAVLPSPGDLAANVAAADEIGLAQAATETPQPITNTFNQPLVVDQMTYVPGQLVFPGFDADLLWAFRWYSIVNQVIIWATIGVVFSAFVGRLERGGWISTAPAASSREPAEVR